jgi:hypothetical protein
MFSKEGIVVNKDHKEMNKKYLLHSGNREASIIGKETTKENILIIQGRISKGLHHKEYHSLTCM